MKILAFAFMLVFVASSAFAQQAAQPLGDFNYWASYSYDKDGDKVCYMFSTPMKTTPKLASRDESFLVITNNLAEATFGIVNIQAGFVYKKDSVVTVTIGKEKFLFSPFGDMAWIKEGDADVVDAMVKGNVAVVEAETEDGKIIKDTFSLSGFTKAKNAINKACAQ